MKCAFVSTSTFLAALAVAVVVDAQRFEEGCVAANCAGFDTAANCDDFRYLSRLGHCSAPTDNKVLSTDVTLRECSALVANDTDCDSIFEHSTNGRCECHLASATEPCVIVGINSGTTSVLVNTNTSVFCSCSPADGTSSVFNGGQCENAKDTHVVFAAEMNVLNDLVNNGLVHGEVVRSAAASDLSIFNFIDLTSPAQLLPRGFDGSIVLRVLLSGDVAGNSLSFDDIHHFVIEGMERALARQGIQKSGKFLPLRGDFLVTVDELLAGNSTPCECPEAARSGAVCDAFCTPVELEYLVLEAPALEIWEISLIIIAGVLLVCALAIGLSFVKSAETKEAEAAAEVEKVRR